MSDEAINHVREALWLEIPVEPQRILNPLRVTCRPLVAADQWVTSRELRCDQIVPKTEIVK